MSESNRILDLTHLPGQPASASTAAAVPSTAAPGGAGPHATVDPVTIRSLDGRRQFFEIPVGWGEPLRGFVFDRLNFFISALPFIHSTDNEDC